MITNKYAAIAAIIVLSLCAFEYLSVSSGKNENKKRKKEWVMQDSNLRPPACRAGALNQLS